MVDVSVPLPVGRGGAQVLHLVPDGAGLVAPVILW